ncbi:putative phage tail assembly chaperone [Maridesulfovibrio bastinii]|uniref:putative phage tail assembly chaperone n=1 Tax=Maridesulfovibrio bastinii TaxID=47157 RepID=UPI0004121A26|nr:putative phage tail assembly chaperone [Maridesulfovibrio bastinii]
MIALNINGQEFEFTVTVAIYNQYINEMQPNNKVTPAHNFLMRSIKPEQKDDFKTVMELPGAPIQIAAKIIEEYSPDLEITVGK